MRRALREDCAAADGRARNDHGNLPATAFLRRSLIEDDEDRRRRKTEERSDEGSKPTVADRDRTVVHVVAQVWHDERVRGELPRIEIVQRDDMAGAAGEVEKRDVLLREAARGGITLGERRPIVGPVCRQSVQSFVTPCVEPETSAK
jgi:hypothetical protein